MTKVAINLIFLKISTDNCKEIMSWLYDNNLVVVGPKDDKVRPTTLP